MKKMRSNLDAVNVTLNVVNSAARLWQISDKQGRRKSLQCQDYTLDLKKPRKKSKSLQFCINWVKQQCTNI